MRKRGREAEVKRQLAMSDVPDPRVKTKPDFPRGRERLREGQSICHKHGL